MELFKKKGVDLMVYGTSVRTPFFYGTTVASQTIPDLMLWTAVGVHKVRAPACTHTRERSTARITHIGTHNHRQTHTRTHRNCRSSAKMAVPRILCPLSPATLDTTSRGESPPTAVNSTARAATMRSPRGNTSVRRQTPTTRRARRRAATTTRGSRSGAAGWTRWAKKDAPTRNPRTCTSCAGLITMVKDSVA